jgi:signal transduction histidine kinase
LVVDAEGNVQDRFRRELAALTAADGFAIAADGMSAADQVRSAAPAFTIAFVALRLPRGPDGAATAETLLAADSHLQVVLCVATDDEHRTSSLTRLAREDRVLLLRTPCPPFELQQLVRVLASKHALTVAHRHAPPVPAQISDAEQSLVDDHRHQALRMEAIGRLAGGVAHDFNNLLTAILGYAELLRMHLPHGDRLMTYAQEIYRSGQRAAGLTSQLLAFSKRQSLTPQVVDLNHVVRDMESLVSRMIGEEIALEIRLDQELCAVRVDPAQLEQVVMNLVANARDAILNGRTGPAARTVIATAAVKVDERMLAPHLHFSPGNGTPLVPGTYACLSVANNGQGLEASMRAHIFEPFYSTKGTISERKGAGLGLATVYGIIQQSGGFIEIDSAPTKGTTFRIYLPYAGEPAIPKSPSGAWQRTLSGSETVLLVEDQDEVRTLLEQVLCAAGYTVLAAENPDVALGLAKQYGGRIHVMVTDMVMPRMDGHELRDAIHAINPGLRVIFMSGYPERDRSLGTTRQPFLQKPFKGEKLLRTVRAVLES